MQVEGKTNSGSRWAQRALIAVAALALLAGAAYVWGNQLNAEIQQTSTQRSADASAARYGSLRGLAAVRAVDVVAAPRTNALQGIAAVRALEVAAVPRGNALEVTDAERDYIAMMTAARTSSLRGLAAVRAADGAAVLASRSPAAAATAALNGRMVGIGSITSETRAAAEQTTRRQAASPSSDWVERHAPVGSR